MLSNLTEPQVHQWTRSEYYKIDTLGLFRERRVELIEGQIIDMSPMGSSHATAVKLVDVALQNTFSAGCFTRCQLPLVLGERSEPQPDVAVIQGQIRDFVDEHPRTAVLVVEVADTSLDYDRDVKGSLYAMAGIPEYWIVNLGDRQLQIYRIPAPSSETVYGYAYTQNSVAPAGDNVQLQQFPRIEIQVADLLP